MFRDQLMEEVEKKNAMDSFIDEHVFHVKTSKLVLILVEHFIRDAEEAIPRGKRSLALDRILAFQVVVFCA